MVSGRALEETLTMDGLMDGYSQRGTLLYKL